MTEEQGSPALDIAAFLHFMQRHKGSDCFFSVGAPPHLKIEGHSQPVGQRKLQAGVVAATTGSDDDRDGKRECKQGNTRHMS